MSWAMRRRLIIFGIITAVVALIVGGTFYLGAYKAPSCTDTKQNQKEEGIDCGGPCPYLCTASEAPPSVRFVRAVSPLPGRTDVVAYIDNPNHSSAIHAAVFTIELYDANNSLIAKQDGTVDLLPDSTAAVFVPNFFSGSRVVAHEFLTFASTSLRWYAYIENRSLPKVTDIVPTEGDAPRVTATVTNTSATPISNLILIATVFDSSGNAIAASQTVAPFIPPQGPASIVFTWPIPFTGPVAKVEVVPVLTVGTLPQI